MKIVTSIIFILAIFVGNTLSSPEYETPSIIPMDNRPGHEKDFDFSSRFDLLNAPSQEKWKYIENGKTSVRLRNNITRENFSLKSLNEWIDFKRGHNLNYDYKDEFTYEVQYIKTLSRMLESFVVEKANKIRTDISLIDLKLAEARLLQNENDALKNGLDPKDPTLYKILTNINSGNSEWSLFLNDVNHVRKNIKDFLKDVKKDLKVRQTVNPVSKLKVPAMAKVEVGLEVPKKSAKNSASDEDMDQLSDEVEKEITNTKKDQDKKSHGKGHKKHNRKR